MELRRESYSVIRKKKMSIYIAYGWREWLVGIGRATLNVPRRHNEAEEESNVETWLLLDELLVVGLVQAQDHGHALELVVDALSEGLRGQRVAFDNASALEKLNEQTSTAEDPDQDLGELADDNSTDETDKRADGELLVVELLAGLLELRADTLHVSVDVGNDLLLRGGSVAGVATDTRGHERRGHAQTHGGSCEAHEARHQTRSCNSKHGCVRV